MDYFNELLKNDLDKLAGAIRNKYLSPGQHIDQEYLFAYQQALDFQAAGFTGTTPPMVQTWVDIKGITPQAAAEQIISTRNDLLLKAETIRDARLKGKAAIDASLTPEEAEAAYMAAEQELLVL